MRKATIRLVGITPLFPDPMSGEVLESLRKGGKMPDQNKGRPADDVAKTKFYRDAEGFAGIPLDNLISCLVEAGRGVKNGKSKISTAGATTLYELITSFEPNFLRFANIPKGKKEPEWVTDVRRGVGHNVNPPVAVAITRPRLDEWELEPLIITYDDTRVHLANMIDLFRLAGTSNGLCGARPNKSRMRFGRFKVVEWAEEAIEEAKSTLIITRDGKRINVDGSDFKEDAA